MPFKYWKIGSVNGTVAVLFATLFLKSTIIFILRITETVANIERTIDQAQNSTSFGVET